MHVEPLPGGLYVLDLGHPDLREMLNASSSFTPESSSRRIRATARFVRARCRGGHPMDRRMFIFDIVEGTPDHFSLKSDAPGAMPYEIYGLIPDAEILIPSCLVIEGASAGIR